MKPPSFAYLAPDSLAATLEALAQYGYDGKVLAGGQSLIPAMNFRMAQPAVLVDVNRVPGLDGVRQENGGGLKVGGMVRQRQLERDGLVAEVAPLLHETMPFVAHPQIRNRGTIGGSLAHADPAAELPVITVALDAHFRLQRQGGERWVAANEFFQGMFATALEPEELLVEVEIPAMRPGTGVCFQEVARRRGDYALVGIAVLVTLDESGVCRRARLVYLNVGEGPVDAQQAAHLLEGSPITEQAIEAAAEQAATQEIDPVGNMHASADFQRHLARVLTKRAVRTAAERAMEKMGTRRNS
jgi:CO/xanthine dehydrogenase FAD-binding subunit